MTQRFFLFYDCCSEIAKLQQMQDNLNQISSAKQASIESYFQKAWFLLIVFVNYLYLLIFSILFYFFFNKILKMTLFSLLSILRTLRITYKSIGPNQFVIKRGDCIMNYRYFSDLQICIHSTPVNPDKPDFFDFVFGSWLLIRHLRVFFKMCNPDSNRTWDFYRL